MVGGASSCPCRSGFEADDDRHQRLLALSKVCRLTQNRGPSDAEDCRATKAILDLHRRKFRVPAPNIILRRALTTVLC